jgi:hypothetical protein
MASSQPSCERVLRMASFDWVHLKTCKYQHHEIRTQWATNNLIIITQWATTNLIKTRALCVKSQIDRNQSVITFFSGGTLPLPSTHNTTTQGFVAGAAPLTPLDRLSSSPLTCRCQHQEIKITMSYQQLNHNHTMSYQQLIHNELPMSRPTLLTCVCGLAWLWGRNWGSIAMSRSSRRRR